ncbi:MAG: arginine N-succinyltransferase [Proteobacteria bacterium]|nr:arginine N-succinyltransferase [Pseudomonadota bacterium]
MIVITVAVTLSLGYWVVNSYLFPSSFTPVVLSKKDQQQLDHKLKRLAGASAPVRDEKLEPEAYSESGADREINISEKEFNALLAKNTNLASKLAIDFSDDLASAKLLIDLDPDLPVFGGRTLKVTAGVEIKLIDGKPGVVLKGVSVWGVPLPNAWLGNMKDADLSRDFGQQGGFWQALNDGIEDIEVKEGQLHIKLKE